MIVEIINLALRKNETFTKDFIIRETVDTFLDLTGKTIALYIEASKGGGPVAIISAISALPSPFPTPDVANYYNSYLLTGGDANLQPLTVKLTDEFTESLQFTTGFYYIISEDDITGDQYRIAAGSIIVKEIDDLT